MIGEEARVPLTPGAVLRERWRIERLIGDDAPGRRYLAADMQAGRALVVCEYPLPPAEIGDREEAVTWFAAAAERWAGLLHPGIVAMRDHWAALEDHGGALYLVRDHRQGMTLAEELHEAGGSIGWRQALDWVIAIGEMLAYPHGKGITFGAVRPDHFVLDVRTDTPILVEFGLGRFLAPEAGDQWGYVPFEQLIGRAEPRSDLYALGVLLHTLLGGEDPDWAYGRFRRQGLDAQRARLALFPSASWTALAVPHELITVLHRATAFGAADRYPDVAAMLEALRAAQGPQVEVESAGSEREPETRPPWTRLGMDRDAWFALPAALRNRKLLELAAEQ
jgi:serine/threonine protein kinase